MNLFDYNRSFSIGLLRERENPPRRGALFDDDFDEFFRGSRQMDAWRDLRLLNESPRLRMEPDWSRTMLRPPWEEDRDSSRDSHLFKREIRREAPPSLKPDVRSQPEDPMLDDFFRSSSPHMDKLSEDKQRLLERLKIYDLRERRKIDGDGNCQFSAVSDQLFKTPKYHTEIRKLVVKWLRQNENYQTDKDTHLKDFLETECYSTWTDYCDYMAQDGTWGDHMTLIAISELFQTTICIVSSVKTGNNPKADPFTIIEPRLSKSKRVALLSLLHEHHYGSLITDDSE